MKEMKRILSLVLCAVMLVGYIPVGALATEGETATEPSVTEAVVETTEAVVETTEAVVETTEAVIETTEAVVETTEATVPETTEETVPETTPVRQPVMMGMMVSKKEATGESAVSDNDYLFIATDRHANTSVIGNIINNMESAIGENELDYLGLGGDMVGSGNSHPTYNSSTVLGEVTGATSSLSAANVDIVAGIHDMNVTDDAGIVLPYQGGGAQIYEGDKFYVYGVEEYCISDDSNSSNWSAQAQAFVDWANGEDIDKSKVIVVVSHYPLHAKRDDNDGAYYWHQALNTVATGAASGDSTVERDILFFHGHNHTVDSNEYVYNVGDTMSIQNGSSITSGTIYYTYATAGYLNQNSKATLVAIDDTTITLTKYSTSGNGTAMTSLERVAEEAAPVETTVSDDFNNGDSITATGLGLTGISIQWNDIDLSATLDEQAYSAYDVNIEGYTGGDMTVTLDVGFVAGEDVKLYDIAEDGTLTPVEITNVTVGEDSSKITFTATSANFTVAVGNPAASSTIPEGAVLTRLDIVGPEKTKYFLSEDLENGNVYLDIAGLGVTAVYTLEDVEYTKALDWNRFDETADGYALSFGDLTTKGEKTVTVSYGDQTAQFTVWVCEKTVSDETSDVFVTFDTESVTALTVQPAVATDTIKSAVAEVITGDVVVYDFIPTYANGDTALTGTATITLPVPVGVTNPVVCYVSDDGAKTEKMPTTKNGDGTLTFTTTHFSTYVVGEGGTEITVPDPETATGNGSTSEEKEVYVLVSTPTAGKQYIIASTGSAGEAYALKENTTTGSSITINAASGSITAPYIETTDETIMWNTASGMTFQSENGGYYLRYNSGLTFSTINSTGWTVGTNSAYTYSSSRYRYVYNNNGTWTTSSSRNTSSSYNAYFYEKQSVTVNTNISGTYSIAGEDLTKVVVAGTTANLKSTLTFTPESGSATTTDVSTTATYEIVTVDADGNTVNGDPNDIISKIENGVVTFTGNYGEALVKVSYTTDFGVVTDYITVTATEPTYSLEITQGEAVVSGTTVPIKGVTNGQTLQLGTNVFYETADGKTKQETLPEGATLEWHIPEEYQNIATVDHDTGLVTFKGVDGAFYVTATLTVGEKDYTVGVNISATTSQYSVPSDGTTDFPEYPNEGAIRYDKTATAVGNFSETGIAQVELSMTGVPYTTGSEIDVVIMLDMTGSMSTTAMTAAEESAIAFAEQIVKNTDGSYNNNRIAVLAFNSGSSSPYTLWSMGVVTEDTWDTFCTNVRTASDKKVSGGTPYDEALAECQSVLAAAKTDGIGNDRQQFCVFVSDGGPTSYKYITNYDAVKAGTASAYTTSSASASGGSNQSDSNFATIATYTHEYYSTLMKDAGVTMYSVLTGLVAANYPNCTTILQNIASDSSKAYVVEDGSDTSSLTNAFTNIAMEIMQAATDVTVEDKITDEYTMIFDIPEGSKDITGVTNDFYIEFLKYTLDSATHERVDSDNDGDTYDDATSVTKLYLKNTNGVLSAAKDSSGTAYDTPVFKQETIGDKGTLYYWTTDSNYASKAALSYNDGTNTYYFIPYGIKATDDAYDSTKWFNMTSGGYANGNVDGTTNMSDNLVIATPYFVYNAKTKMLYWTLDKMQDATTEYALRYFVYLNNSATEVGTDNETDPGSYLTNDHAYITYTNHLEHECRQEFPKPQLTWSGAQVSYVFYLVNAAGQPINKSGQVVDFANATFITDVYTESTVWNKGEDGQITADSKLSIDWLANKLLPSDYKVYDEAANYKLHVFGDHTGESIFDYFIISGSDATAISTSLNTRLKLETTADTVSMNTTKVYNTKAGTKYSAYGTYTSKYTEDYTNEIALSDFDFYNTTVAFAVVWQPKLVPDTVVVDYGLDVLINVVQNDILQNTVTGIGEGKDAYGNIAMDTGVSTISKLGTADLIIDGNTISIKNENTVCFSQGDMMFQEPVVFYYESPVEFYEGSDKEEGYMYSSVTVIPATTIYYEDSFVDFAVFENGESGWSESDELTWEVAGTTINATQAQDRPGASQISTALDADNNYGYDAAYNNCSMYSLGSARYLEVEDGIYGTATFTFYGTGFDVIGLTSSDTSLITVKVFRGAEATGTPAKNLAVDTYYGYTKDEEGNWVVDADAENALYQVPVISYDDLTYGQYTVQLKCAYNSIVDHQSNGSYKVYLDAIRVYDPTGVVSGSTANDTNGVVSDAYNKDGEAYPAYQALRENIIAASSVTVTKNDNGSLSANLTDDSDNIVDARSGAVFIDGNGEDYSVSDYVSYGPNNELYLAKNQAIAFKVNLTAKSGYEIADVQIGMKSADGKTVTYTVGEDKKTIETSTDMYYSIKDHAVAADGKAATVIITNTSESVLSLTNIKVTYKLSETATASENDGIDTASMIYTDEEVVTYSLMRLSAPSVEEPEVPETTEPVETTEPDESETTEPEETTVPDETESVEPEETQPESSQSKLEQALEKAAEQAAKIAQNMKKAAEQAAKALSKLFSRWF